MNRRPSASSGAAAVALFLSLAAGACGPTPDAEMPPVAGLLAPAAAFLDGADPTGWVTIYDPERAWNGYTLALYAGRVPMVIDMNGRVVHSWPEARVKSRIRLLADGSLLGLALGRAVVEYDWDGKLVWEAPIEDAIPHHDVIRLANGNTMVLILRTGQRTDDILEIDRAGKTVWEWRSAVGLAGYYDPADPAGEITHLNSVQELPRNRWFDGGDERFRPGNLLISARNLNAVFLIDRETREVVWSYRHQLDRQHEALMIERGFPAAGNILIFDNGYASLYAYRKSKILEVDPTDKSIRWRYEADGFYSPTAGLEQPLANGNVLISSTRGGRAFEINRAGRIVWQWVPPFEPVRPGRVAYDHCPQLAALSRPLETPIRPAAGYRHVDPRVHVYARSSAIAEVRIDGVERQALKDSDSCSRVFVPPAAEIHLGYGINRRAAVRSGRTDYSARFRLSTRLDGDDATVLVDDVLELAQSNWRAQTVPLEAFALRWVELCLAIEGAGPPSETEPIAFAYWTNPVVVSRAQKPEANARLEPVGLSPEESEVQREHLRALGYID